MVTREDVAKMAGVSVGTVSNVLNGKPFVKAEYVSRVKEAIKKLNYVPDSNAKSLAGRRSNHIGVAVYEITNPYHAEIVQGLEEYASGKGYTVTTFPLGNKFNKKLDTICERRLDALVNFMTNELPQEFVNLLEMQNSVLVNFNKTNSFVVINDYSGAMEKFMATLSELGHKQVAYISAIDEIRFRADSRGCTFLSRREEFGFSPDDTLIVCNNDYELSSERAGYVMTDKLIQTHPEATAVFATNDLCAMGVIKRLSELGYKCPDDISVIGCDDISLSSYFVPSLSTLRMDKKKYGADIARVVIDKIEQGNALSYTTLTFCAEAVMRSSVAKAKNTL